jgi:16S rRNA (guanine(966)-N(2))-methyltransferase RsmD
MRIIAGEAKGRILKTPTGRNTRPTDARSRETLFNILSDRVIDARFLDLYAGSGAVGLEALSRGAKSCTFIEQNAAAVNSIRANVKTLGWSESTEVWQTSMRSALHRMREAAEYSGTFDLIFADPPFDVPGEFEDLRNRVDILARLLHNVGELSAGDLSESRSRLLVIQHPQRMSLVLAPPFALWKSRRAGHSLLSFFELIDDQDTDQNIDNQNDNRDSRSQDAA